MSSMMPGKKAILEMLKAEGVEYIFANPLSTCKLTKEGLFVALAYASPIPIATLS